jgi:hypothetical protein
VVTRDWVHEIPFPRSRPDAVSSKLFVGERVALSQILSDGLVICIE